MKELKSAGLKQGKTKPSRMKYYIIRKDWGKEQRLFIEFLSN